MKCNLGSLHVLVRYYSEWRRAAPAVQLALAVAIGQAMVWLTGEVFVVCLLLVLGVRLLTSVTRGLGGVTAGLLLGAISAWSALEVRPEIPHIQEAILQGVVHETPRRAKPGEVVFILRAKLKGRSELIRCRGVELPWRNLSMLEVGDTVVVRGELVPVERAANPFSWHGSLWRKGIVAECRARFVSRAISSTPSLLNQFRVGLKARTTELVGDSGDTGLLLSMALGYRDLISVQIEQAFMRLGLSHLLVVSGYQVSLMYGFVTVLLNIFARVLRSGRRYLKRAAHLIGFVAACLYVVCIGSEMSAMRALVAAACLTAQLCSERDATFAQRWGVALLVLQLIWPWCIFEIGVILTFAALLGIGIGLSLGKAGVITTLFRVNSTVWLTTTFVMVVWKGAVSPLGLIVNLIVAAPWSIINCTVGLVGVVGGLLEIPGSSTVLGLVVWCNSALSTVVLALSDTSYSGWVVNGYLRVVVALAITLLLVAVLRHRVAKAGVPMSAAHSRPPSHVRTTSSLNPCFQ